MIAKKKKLSFFVDKKRGVQEVSIQEHPSNGNRTTADSVRSSSCSALNFWPIEARLTPIVMNVH
jgi:hypothetical protein